MDQGLQGAPEQISRSESWQSLFLWFGLLTGPGAWTIMLLVNYSLEEVISCTAAAATPGVVLGFGVKPIVLILNTVLAAATLLAGLVSFRCYRLLTRSEIKSATDERARWMAVAGIMLSILFLVIIVVSSAPPFLLDVCEPPL
jgi:hypothetical protein